MRNFVYCFLALILLPAYLSGQVIKGKVSDQKGIGIPGAIVVAVDSKSTADADFDGNFNINAKVGEMLKISMLGYDPISVKATLGLMKIILIEDKETNLKEVVVVGYGTRKKIDLTMSVSQVKAEELSKTKVLNASQAIQGKLTGVHITSSDAPGASPTILIRGAGSGLGSNAPLFVIDGIRQNNMNNINTNDIETYEVLKDASALAIYGSESANGVILITTKRAKSGKTAINFESYIGVREPMKTVKMAGSNKYSNYSNIALGTITFSQDQPVNTNWFKEITQTANYRNTNFSISSNSDKGSNLFSVGYYDEEALLKGQGYNRLTLRLDNEYKISEKLKIRTSLNGGFTNITSKPFSAFTAAYKQSPIVPVFFPSGKYGVSFVGSNGFASESGSSFNNVGNPVAQLDFHNEKSRNLNLLGSINLDYKINKQLKFTSRFGGEINNWQGYNFSDSRNSWLAGDPNRVESGYDATAPINVLSKTRSEFYRWDFANFLTYNEVFNEIHDLELTAGIESSSNNNGEYLSATRRDVPANSNYWSLNFSTSNKSDGIGNGQSNERRLNSYFGRVQYKLMNRYLLTAMLRRDGSSQFQEENRWGTFPSVGLGWVVSKEDFLSKSSVVNLLKIRGGWGRLGNQNVPLNTANFATGLNASLGGSTVFSGTTVNSIIDPNLQWEVTEETSVGVDFELLNNRLKGEFNVYEKLNTNAIFYVGSYPTSGVSAATPGHVGEISNSGYEISLRWDDKINENLSYWIGGNYSNNKNELLSVSSTLTNAIRGGGLGNGQHTKLLGYDAVGQPVGSFWIWEQSGFDADGNMTFLDKNGKIVAQSALKEEDRKFMGSVIPKSIYGVTLGVKFKSVELSIDGYGTGGAKVYNGKKAQRFSGENIEYDMATDFWSASNPNAANPAPFNAVPIASSYYLESGDFFRVNNISLGYTLPNLPNISSVRVYVNAINPFISQKYSGYSPEINGGVMDGMGIELDAYPTLKSLIFGVNVKL
jgi:TonB-linked SusC/RagA family outer membrane protein